MPLDLGLARDAGGADALGFSQACAELGACRRIPEENAAELSERGNATKPRPLLFITRWATTSRAVWPTGAIFVAMPALVRSSLGVGPSVWGEAVCVMGER
jgi:hypothetical protein